MDSTRPAVHDRPTEPDDWLDVPDGAVVVTETVPSKALMRASRLGSAARRSVRAAWWMAAAGALGAVPVWALLFRQALAAGSISWPVAGLVGAVLLVPAGAAAVLAHGLGELVALPGALRDAARRAVSADAVPGDAPGGLFRTVWALRALAAEGVGSWTMVAGAVRLASLPLVLGLLAGVALNAVVAAAGVVALAWMIL